jgi:hypothetical protein
LNAEQIQQGLKKESLPKSEAERSKGQTNEQKSPLAGTKIFEILTGR